MRVTDLYKLQLVNGLSATSDLSLVVYSIQKVIRKENKKVSNIFLFRKGDRKGQQITHAAASDVMPSVSPDGQHLAFLSDRTVAGEMELYLMKLGGGEPCRVTVPYGNITDLQWAPDSSSLAFVHTPGKKSVDANQVSNVTIKSLYKLDGVGFDSGAPKNVCVLSVKSRQIKRLVTVKDSSLVQYCWFPNSQELLFSRQVKDTIDSAPSMMSFFAVRVASKKVRRLPIEEGAYFAPSVSPNGEQVALVGSKDERFRHYNCEVFVADLVSGTVVSRSAEYDLHFADITLSDCIALNSWRIVWSADSRAAFALASWQGRTGVYEVQMRGEPLVHTALQVDGSISSFVLDTSCRSYVIHSSSQIEPSKLQYGEFESSSPKGSITTLNSRVPSVDTLGKVEEVWLPSRGKRPPLHGWIYFPPNFSSRKKYPCIIEVHGGPRMQYGHAFMHEFRYLTDSGYVVACCNPRGSQGYGERFAQSIDGAWGSVDVEDILRFSNYVSRKRYVRSLGITGGSYGGYMVNLLIGRTDMYQAAVTQRSICNFVSFYGTSDLGWQTERLLGKSSRPWRDLDYYWKISPLSSVHSVKTPCLVIHSVNDLRCPLEQGEQWYSALRKEGVETRLVVFPDESHGLSRAGRTDRRIKRLEEIRLWFDRFLQ